MSASGGNKAILAAFFANLGIAIIKFIGFVITGASSMLSEAIHSVADTGNQALLLLGRRKADKDADDEHQFGYGRERFFWAFVVAVILFALGSVFAIYEGIHKIQHPEELFLEDFGAMTGLVIALGAVTTSVVTGNGVYDGIGSVAIGLILGVIAVILCIEMKSLLIGEPAMPEDRAKLRTAIESSPDVVRLIHERTEYIGAEQVLLAAKVEFSERLTVAGLADAINTLEANVRAAVPAIELVYIEPDLFRVVDRDRGDPPDAVR